MTVKLTDFGIARGDRADPDHPGRLGGRHRRLPRARAGARRGGDAGGRRLRARRRPLPVPHRPPALRGLLAGRARGAPAEREPLPPSTYNDDVPETLGGRRAARARGRPDRRYCQRRELAARRCDAGPAGRGRAPAVGARLPTDMLGGATPPRPATSTAPSRAPPRPQTPAAPRPAPRPLPRRAPVAAPRAPKKRSAFSRFARFVSCC